MNNSLFSSVKADWETPDSLFEELNDEFRFTLDAAASPNNAKCDRFFCEPHWYRSHHADAMGRLWYGRVWLNPPYGRGVSEWVDKAARAAFYTAQVVVMLVPARTDTAWWHDYIWDRNRNMPRTLLDDGVTPIELRFLCGRLRFKGAPASAPFPSAVVVFRAPDYGRPE